MAAASEVSSLDFTLTQPDIADPQEEICGFCGAQTVGAGECIQCPLIKELVEKEEMTTTKNEGSEG